jgi:hypothetical protein
MSKSVVATTLPMVGEHEDNHNQSQSHRDQDVSNTSNYICLTSSAYNSHQVDMIINSTQCSMQFVIGSNQCCVVNETVRRPPIFKNLFMIFQFQFHFIL